MDGGRIIYLLTEIYVLLLIVGAIGTTLWVAVPTITLSPTLAGFWLGVGGFGLLTGVTVIVVRVGRPMGQ